MSRIGRKPVSLPAGVTAAVAGRRLTVKGPKGELSRTFHPDISIEVKDGRIVVGRPSDEARHRALHGLSRTLVANMVEGVTKGFAKQLAVVGVGYKAELNPSGLTLVVGLSHPVNVPAPPGIAFTVETPAVKVADNHSVTITVSGADKELVGLVTANLRGVRPPEPYKGKGIRYVGEKVRRKAGKTATGAVK